MRTGEGSLEASPVGGEGMARAPGEGRTTFPVKKPTRRPRVPALSPNPRHGPRPSPTHLSSSPQYSLTPGVLGLLPVHFFLVGEGKEATAITWAGGVTSQEEGREGRQAGRVGGGRPHPSPSCLPAYISPRALHTSPTSIFSTFQPMPHDGHAGPASHRLNNALPLSRRAIERHRH